MIAEALNLPTLF